MSADAAQVQDLLDTASRLRGDERDRFVSTACGKDERLRRELESLLAALDRSGDFLEKPTVTFAPAAGESAGETIDRYRLVNVIGEGGFGVVWRAEQLRPVRRDVALKIVKAGMDTPDVLARFASEQQALAVLEHQAVARVYDAGTTPRGRPYFVMELVDGRPLTAYCDANRLTVRRRVALLADVCDAIHHAHQRGILHRDLKPSNVLVAEVDGRPVVKVIDFGVAKALRQPLSADAMAVTQAGHWLGTPAYMSPEQFTNPGALDTRGDLYSLGVILYELVTGTTALLLGEGEKVGPAELERRVTGREAQPPLARLAELGEGRLARAAAARSATPTELRRAVRGELTWIVGKCLELEPSRRYPSVAHLGEELRRYLAGRPVEVGPPGAAYRVRRFVRRRRRAVGTWALVAVAVVAATWGWAMRRAYGPESRAAIYDLSSRGDQLRVEGKFKDAEPLLRQAVYRAETLFGRYDSACVDPLWHLIQLLNDQGRYEEALEFNRRLFDIVRYGNLSPAWAADLSDWYGGALVRLGRYPEAEAALAESIAIQERAGYHKTHKYEANIEKLIEMCEQAGRPDDAARWRAKLKEPASRPTPVPQ
jgi:hypothetical protein